MLPPDARLLLVDDDERLRERMALALRRRGVEVLTADGPQRALAVQEVTQPTHAVLDLRMPGGSGLDLMAAMLEREPSLQILLLTGFGSIAAAVEAMRQGAVNVLSKPIDADELLAAFSGRAAAQPETPSLARAEWEHIQRVLRDCDGNVSEAARRLGLHRRTLQRKLAVGPG
jgi:two-component system response regulator RegA